MQKPCAMMILAALVSLHSLSCSRPHFPEYKASPTGLVGSWDRATAVVVADVRNFEYLGSQKITKSPWPQFLAPFKVYWCQGDFEKQLTLRGDPPDTRNKFLWASGKPDCDMSVHGKGVPEDQGPLMHIWFVREEGDYIRPVVDSMGVYFVAFKVKWEMAPGEDPEKKFAQLLLTPAAVDTDPRHYGQNWDFDLASTACHILGKTECIEQIRGLASLGDPRLRRNACDFLASQFRREEAQFKVACAP